MNTRFVALAFAVALAASPDMAATAPVPSPAFGWELTLIGAPPGVLFFWDSEIEPGGLEGYGFYGRFGLLEISGSWSGLVDAIVTGDLDMEEVEGAAIHPATLRLRRLGTMPSWYGSLSFYDDVGQFRRHAVVLRQAELPPLEPSAPWSGTLRTGTAVEEVNGWIERSMDRAHRFRASLFTPVSGCAFSGEFLVSSRRKLFGALRVTDGSCGDLVFQNGALGFDGRRILLRTIDGQVLVLRR